MLIGRCMGYVQYVAFSPDDLTVALCVDREVFILDTTVSNTVYIVSFFLKHRTDFKISNCKCM